MCLCFPVRAILNIESSQGVYDAYSRINITHLLQAEMKREGCEERIVKGGDKQRKISLLGYTSHVFPALFPHEFFFFSSLFITSSHSTCHKCLWLKLTLHSGSKGPKFQCSRQEREHVREKNRLKNERGKRKGTFFPLLVADLGCMASSDPDTLSPSHCPPAKDCKL